MILFSLLVALLLKMISSFLLMFSALVAMVDGIGLDEEEELDYDEGGAGAAGTVRVSSTGDGAAGSDEILTGSGLATLSESDLLAGEDETSHIEFGDPPAKSTPEPEPMEVTAVMPPPPETRKPVHYNTSWAYCDLRIQEILYRIECILKSRGVSKCPFCGSVNSDFTAHASQHFFAWFCCVDGFSQTSRDVVRRHMRERHGDSVATMASVSAAGYSKYHRKIQLMTGSAFQSSYR